MTRRKVTNTTNRFQIHGTALEGMIFGASATIERQEAQGQRELTQSDTLPLRGSKNPAWEKIGVKFGEAVEGDSLFRYVTLPPGWKKLPTDHSMWSKLVDDKGRERARGFSTRPRSTTATRTSASIAASKRRASRRAGGTLATTATRNLSR